MKGQAVDRVVDQVDGQVVIRRLAVGDFMADDAARPFGPGHDGQIKVDADAGEIMADDLAHRTGDVGDDGGQL